MLVILLSLPAAALAGQEDTAIECPGGYPTVPGATYTGSACHGSIEDFCAERWDGPCLNWLEFSVGGFSPEWTVIDCDAGDTVAHRAIWTTTSFKITFDFDPNGVLVGVQDLLADGAPWCCEGHTSYVFISGDLSGNCYAVPEHGCGCAEVGGTRPALVGALLGLSGMLLRRRKS